MRIARQRVDDAAQAVVPRQRLAPARRLVAVHLAQEGLVSRRPRGAGATSSAQRERLVGGPVPAARPRGRTGTPCSRCASGSVRAASRAVRRGPVHRGSPAACRCDGPDGCRPRRRAGAGRGCRSTAAARPASASAFTRRSVASDCGPRLTRSPTKTKRSAAGSRAASRSKLVEAALQVADGVGAHGSNTSVCARLRFASIGRRASSRRKNTT